MNELSLPGEPGVIADHGDLTLDDLASRAVAEHRLVSEAVTAALQHAIVCGVVLLRARTMIPKGEWAGWLRERGIPLGTASQYCRVAFYRAELYEANARGEKILSVQRAYLYLQGMPYLPRLGGGDQANAALITRNEVRRLHAEGCSQGEIGRRLGLSRAGIRYHLRPEEEKKRRNRLKAEKKRINRLEKSRAVAEDIAKRRGGSVGEAYALIRRAAQQLQAAIEQAENRDERATYRLALASVHEAEDALGRAIRVRLPSDPRPKGSLEERQQT